MSDNTIIDQPVKTGQVKPVNAEKTEEPKPWVVVIHNDNTTPPGEVVSILREHFDHNSDRAYKIMMAAHIDGEAEVQRYQGKDIAETKAAQATQTARGRTNPYFNNMPLELTFSAQPL